MSLIPPLPPEALACVGEVALRYADVVADGRLVLTALPEALGQVVWPGLQAHVPVDQFVATGAVPILTRMVLEGGDGPLSVYRPLRAIGAFALAHTPGPAGPERILLNMWGELQGEAGWTWGQPAPPHTLSAGRVFAEHTFTRLFAPAGERRVTALEVPGLPAVPPLAWPRRGPEELGPPAGTRLLEEREERFVFGQVHTDPNLHVNSMVYPRLFEELALRVAAQHGANELFARGAELIWRKPFFPGEVATIRLRLWERGGRMEASGHFEAEGQIRALVTLRF